MFRANCLPAENLRVQNASGIETTNPVVKNSFTMAAEK
jgi:hypothetical protein